MEMLYFKWNRESVADPGDNSDDGGRSSFCNPSTSVVVFLGNILPAGNSPLSAVATIQQFATMGVCE